MSDMAARILRFLAHRIPGARGMVIDELSRIPGGSSQETFKLVVTWDEGAGPATRRLILRRAPAQGLVVAERDLEFTVYRALAGSGLPVPAVHFMEQDPQWLDRPFFVMDMAAGKPGHFYQSDDPYEGKAGEVGAAFWRHLGALAAIDHRVVGLERLRNGDLADRFWSAELEWWEAILDKNERLVEPATRGAIRWLRAHPPAEPAKPALVHGDYRVGNFLFTPDGQISAVLDWEMAHIGDPLEDIAWALNPMWSMDRHFALEEGLALWEAGSGMPIDRAALDWWRLFATVKASSIWITAEAAVVSGQSRDMTTAMSAVRAQSFHRLELLDRMAERGMMG